jgi:hypothetical protein
VTRLRTLVLVGLVAGLSALLGVTPANAAFSTRTTVTPMGIGTASVQAPGAVKGTVTCGGSTSTLNLSWTASSTPGVTGYVVRLFFSDGYTQTLTAQTATTWSGSVNKYYVTATTVHMTVTAQTGYGWTRESLASAELSC